MRSRLKQFLADRFGLSVQRQGNVPFGVDWMDDLAFHLGEGPHLLVDVGANEGQTALGLHRRFPSAEIHSFEPVPEIYEALVGNVDGTGVRTVESAVGDYVGHATIHLGASPQQAGFQASGEGIGVEVTTLDEYAKASCGSSIDLLKVDVEGHEPAVLRGASELLARGDISFVLCECEFSRRAEEPHGSFAEIFGLLEPHGYRVVAFYCSGIDNLGWLWGDVLFRYVPPDARRGPFAMSPFAIPTPSGT